MINSVSSFSGQMAFKGDIVYKDRYIPDKQDQTLDIIRAHAEYELGSNFFYLDQIANEKLAAITLAKKDSLNGRSEPVYKKKLEVDEKALSSLKISSFRIRRPNELYSGENLSDEPEKLKEMKDAGIKSVLCLVPYSNYEDNASEAGLNFADFTSITGLNVFDVKGDLIKNLIDHPESYAEDNGKVGGLKKFVKILNGDDKKYPLPIYFGCQNGTDRTFMWYQVYNILKDEDMSKPLSENAIKKLAEFHDDVIEYFRW